MQSKQRLSPGILPRLDVDALALNAVPPQNPTRCRRLVGQPLRLSSTAMAQQRGKPRVVGCAHCQLTRLCSSHLSPRQFSQDMVRLPAPNNVTAADPATVDRIPMPEIGLANASPCLTTSVERKLLRRGFENTSQEPTKSLQNQCIFPEVLQNLDVLLDAETLSELYVPVPSLWTSARLISTSS